MTKGNPSLSNKPFPEKKGKKDTQSYCYENSLLLEEREIAARWNDWTVVNIEERRAILLDWARKRWHVDFSESGGDTYDPDDETDESVDTT